MKLGALVGGSAAVIGPEATVADAAETVITDGVGSLGVVSGRQLVGIITERDVVRCIAAGSDPEDEQVSDWMSDAPDTFSPDVDCTEAAACFRISCCAFFSLNSRWIFDVARKT